MRLGGVKQASGHQQVAGNFVSHLPDQHGRNDGGHKSDAHLGVAKLGFGHGQGEIAHGGKSSAARDGRAVYRGDGRQREIVKAPKDARYSRRVLHVFLVRLPQQILQFIEIETGTKSLARAGEDYHLSGGLLDLVESSQQFLDQRKTDRIAFFWTVERDGSDTGIEGKLNGFIFHRFYSPWFATALEPA